MKMNLSRNEAQSLQLADRLETEIRNRILPPGSKLLSTRSLSEQFDIDRNVVRAALDMLEARKLIVRRPRQGIYVNPELLSLGRPEIYIFTFGGTTPSYVETALDLQHNREYMRNCNVTIRYACWEELNLQTFENEMVKARQVSPGIIVLASTYVDRPKLEILRAMRIPFVILGEYHHDVSGLDANRIFEQFAPKGLAIGRFFAESSYREMAYFTFPGNMLDYEIEYRTLLRCHAAAAGKKFIETELSFDPETEVNDQHWQQKAVHDLFASGARPDLLHFIDGVDVAGIQQVLDEFHLHIPEDVNLLLYHPLAENPVPGLLEIRVDYSRFSAAAFELILQTVRTGENFGVRDLTHLVNYHIGTIA